MTTFAVSMVRDENDVIEGMLRHLADEVDHLIVADNGSTDGTRDILDQLVSELPLTVVDQPDPAYYQSRHMSALAEMAAQMGATWIVPADADELWVAYSDRIRIALAGLPKAVRVVRAQLINHFCTAIDTDDLDPFRSMVWRQQEPMVLPKVAFRWAPGAVIHQGNHGVSMPGTLLTVGSVLEVRHFPYRSAGQFVSKARNGAAAYRATDLPESEGAHWRAYGDTLDRWGPEALINIYREHFWYLSPADSKMVRDPAPYLRWQS